MGGRDVDELAAIGAFAGVDSGDVLAFVDVDFGLACICRRVNVRKGRRTAAVRNCGASMVDCGETNQLME